jgi:hypothetical protein
MHGDPPAVEAALHEIRCQLEKAGNAGKSWADRRDQVRRMVAGIRMHAAVDAKATETSISREKFAKEGAVLFKTAGVD